MPTPKRKDEKRDAVRFDAIPSAGLVEAEVIAVETSLAAAVQEASGLVVADAATHVRASELLVALKRVLNSGEERRKAHKEPFLKAGRAIDAAYAHVLGPVQEVYDDLNRRATTWAVQEEDRRSRVLADQRERERVAQEAANKAASATGAAPVTVIPRQAPPEVQTHRKVVGGGSTSIPRRWTYEVTDREALMAAHPELFDLNPKRTQGLVTSGVRECPGLRIYQTATTAVST